MASNRRVRRRDKVVARETDNFLASRRTERADDVLADLPQASIRHTELHGAGGRTPMDVANDSSFAAGKAFIAEVRAAGGTWKKWLRAPHRDVMRYRSLLVRKRATTSDPVLAFVFRLGDNGIFWKLLGFWPGRVLPPGVRY